MSSLRNKAFLYFLHQHPFSLHFLPHSCVKKSRWVVRLWSPLQRQPGHHASPLSSPCLGDLMSLYMVSSTQTAELLSGRPYRCLSASSVVYCGAICTISPPASPSIDSYSAEHIWFKWSGFQFTASICTEHKGLECMACFPLKNSFVLHFVEWKKLVGLLQCYFSITVTLLLL